MHKHIFFCLVVNNLRYSSKTEEKYVYICSEREGGERERERERERKGGLEEGRKGGWEKRKRRKEEDTWNHRLRITSSNFIVLDRKLHNNVSIDAGITKIEKEDSTINYRHKSSLLFTVETPVSVLRTRVQRVLGRRRRQEHRH